MIRNARVSVITNYNNPTLWRPKMKKRKHWERELDDTMRLILSYCHAVTREFFRCADLELLAVIYWDGWISRNPVGATDINIWIERVDNFRWHSLALFSEQTILCFPRTIAFLEMHKYCTKSWRWWMNLLWPLPLYIKRKTYDIKISSICSLYI